jgi:Concanavalin A-like lectin/glucanases superfamily
VFCTAPGNNSNNGLTAATPVASLTGLLSFYTFHPGDTIYIDTGAYDLVRNVTLGPAFRGVHIVGAGPREVTPSLVESAVLADGPVAFRRLGDAGGTTAADATGNGYNGTYVGNVTPDPNAPSNDGAAYFNGQNSYVNVPYAAALAPNQFTIEAWVNFQGNPSTPFDIFSMNSYYLLLSDGNITLTAPFSDSISAPLPAGTWTDVVATLNSN